MEQLFNVGPDGVSRAMAQQQCFRQAQAVVAQLEERLQPMTPAQQRDYLETHHRTTLQKFGDLLRQWDRPENDVQATQRLLQRVRDEQNARCVR